MKRHFLTGLAMLLPMVLTFMIFVFVLHLIINPFLGIATAIVHPLVPEDADLFFFTHNQWVRLLSKCLVVASLIGIVLLAGLFGRIYIGQYLVGGADALLQKVPGFRTLYKMLKEVVNMIFSRDAQSFSKAVLAPFPHGKALCIGMATTDINAPIVSVFLPGTPNPTVGYVLQFKKEQLVLLDMSVDAAFKLIVSCGTAIGKQVEEDR
jgi:uncharacterized membrane protein